MYHIDTIFKKHTPLYVCKNLENACFAFYIYLEQFLIKTYPDLTASEAGASDAEVPATSSHAYVDLSGGVASKPSDKWEVQKQNAKQKLRNLEALIKIAEQTNESSALTKYKEDHKNASAEFFHAQDAIDQLKENNNN